MTAATVGLLEHSIGERDGVPRRSPRMSDRGVAGLAAIGADVGLEGGAGRPEREHNKR